MNLLIISHKECWRDINHPAQYVTKGGFPYQVEAISHLFDETVVMITLFPPPSPEGATPLQGHCMTVMPLPAPLGQGLRRKLDLLFWFPKHSLPMWRRIGSTDAVHALVPGDIGSLGLLLAWLQRKPLFVRHCGTWGEPVTVADRLLLWFLERIAGGRTVVMATGGGERPPSARNPHISWIHSTTLTAAELAEIPPKETWRSGDPLQLVTVGRLSRGKNTIDAVRALPAVLETYPDTTLHIVGDGPERVQLEREIKDLRLGDHVLFHGNVDHAAVLCILQTCHLFLFPTKTKEGFPKAVLEALACGLPVIATRVSVLPYLIGAERGVILDEVSPAAVAAAVLDLVSDPARLAQMVPAAQAVAQEYTLERWQTIIAERLQQAWGQPLQEGVGQAAR